MDRSHVQETLASLYLRLNGYFVSGFIVHAPYKTKTEMDVLAVRFPGHEEPEREVQCCTILTPPSDRTDFIIGEVKGGPKNSNFNPRFRTDPEAIRAVLNRFGAFEDEDVKKICRTAPALLAPENLRRSASFPCIEVRGGSAQLRFIVFAPEQQREEGESRPYIFENDLMEFVWKCFRPEQRRVNCDVRYNFELWGPQFVTMVRHLKDETRQSPGTIQDLYRLYGADS